MSPIKSRCQSCFHHTHTRCPGYHGSRIRLSLPARILLWRSKKWFHSLHFFHNLQSLLHYHIGCRNKWFPYHYDPINKSDQKNEKQKREIRVGIIPLPKVFDLGRNEAIGSPAWRYIQAIPLHGESCYDNALSSKIGVRFSLLYVACFLLNFYYLKIAWKAYHF